jgi:hypothetical protein
VSAAQHTWSGQTSGELGSGQGLKVVDVLEQPFANAVSNVIAIHAQTNHCFIMEKTSG